MKIFPAIDIMDGKVVRLQNGNYDCAKEYGIKPLDAANSFFQAGARYLHLIDLDGAREGVAINASEIKKITSETNMFVEVGGGIRTLKQIEDYISSGAARVVLGTAAIQNEMFLIDSIKIFGEKIAIGIDEKDGKIHVKGWKQSTELNAIEFCKRVRDLGVKHIVFTDISKDGALGGTNLELFEVLCKIKNLKITASGGITYLEELKKLKELNIYGAIIGKAIYENKILLKDALEYEEEC